MTAAVPVLETRGITRDYVTGGMFGGKREVRALKGIDLAVGRGRTLAVVGESGCGKSTLGRALLRLIEPSAGRVLHRGEDLLALGRRALRGRRRQLQMVFQDPYGSLNPRHRVRELLGEPLAVHGLGARGERDARVAALLDLVGLPATATDKYPHEFSGGQRQRIAIARALAAEPEIVVADEPVSALDVSVQAQVLNLLADLKARLGLTMIFISHDLSVVRQVSDRVAVMYLGRIVEEAGVEALYAAPAHPYTQALLAAVPLPVPGRRRDRVPLTGETPDPANPPSGCAFHPRCPKALPRCTSEAPALTSRRVADGARRVACHLHEAA